VIHPTAQVFGFQPVQVKPDGYVILPAMFAQGEAVGLRATRAFWRNAAHDILNAIAIAEAAEEMAKIAGAKSTRRTG